MNFSAVIDATTAGAIDAAWLYNALQPVSLFARRAYDAIRPFAPGQEREAEAHARAICDLARSLSAKEVDAMRDALRGSSDPVPALARASMNEALEDPHFLEVLRFLDAAARVHLVQMPDGARAVHDALERGRSGKYGFYLADTFDDALAVARQQADRAQAQFEGARGRLAHRVAQALGRDELRETEFIVMRDECAVLPPEVRVIREAPTYYLCEIDLDEPAVEALRLRDELNEGVAQAEYAVREKLSTLIREHAQALRTVLDETAHADIRLAQVRFAQLYECAPPAVSATPEISFSAGVFLPLKLQLQAQGRAYEPIAVRLSGAAVLTGPNMGGKSAALRTCAFLALLVAFGIPVPATRVECALFGTIGWLGIGTDDATSSLLSSFASEVVRLKELLAGAQAPALILVDEFARTTTPGEGAALLAAVLRGLRRRGFLAFAATHLSGIASAAGARHFAVRGLREMPAATGRADLIAALDALAESMDYSVAEVGDEGPESSDAIALAQLLGLDEDIVADAKESVWIR